MKPLALLLIAVSLASAAELPRPILRTYVLRDEFAALLAKRDRPGRLVSVKEIKSLLDDDFKRRTAAAAEAKASAEKAAEAFPRDLVVEQAEVGVQVAPDRSYARLDVSLALNLHNVKETGFALPAKGLLFEDVKLDGEDALLRPEGEGYRVTVAGDGAHKLTYRAVVKVDPDGYSQTLTAPLPPNPGGTARVTIPGKGLEVRIDPGVDLIKKQDGETTQVDAGLAGGAQLKVSWYTIARHVPAPASGAPEAAPRPGPRQGTPIVFAEVCHVAGITESKLEGVVDFRFTVHRAPVSELTVRLPDGIGPVKLDPAPDVVAEKVVTGNELKVHLTAPSEGEVGFALRYKKELDIKPGERSTETVLPQFEPVGVAAQTGYLVVNRLANVRLEPQSTPTLELLANTPLPDKFRGYRTADSLFTYKYLSLPATLPVKVLSYENEDVLTAVVEEQVATTLFARGGGQLTTVDYFVRNEHTEFLRLELPEKAEMERVLVDGKRVTASRHEQGGVRIPLKSKTSTPRVRVQVAYRTQGETAFRAALPKIDLPALHLDWRWLVPQDTVLVHFNAGSRSLRARPHAAGSNRQTYSEQVPDASELKAYFMTEGLVAKGQSLEVVAQGLHPRERLLPMFIFFLFGALSVGLVARMLFYGQNTRAALVVIAVSYLSLTLVADENELTRPFYGGLNLALWIAVLSFALTGVRETARWVLARFGITLAVALLVTVPAQAGNMKKMMEVDANQAKEEEEKRGLEWLMNSINRRSVSLKSRGVQNYQQQAPAIQQQVVPNDDMQLEDAPSNVGPTSNVAREQNAPPMMDQRRPRPVQAPIAPAAVNLAVPPPAPKPAEPESVAPLRVIMPYDETPGPSTGDGMALVDAEEIARLEAPKPTASASPASPFAALLRDGRLVARVEGKRATVSATYRVRVARKGFVTVALPLGGAALDRAIVDGEPLLLSDAQEAVLESSSDQPADHKIELAYSVPVSDHEDQGELSLTLPQAPVINLELTLPKTGVSVDLSAGQSVAQREQDGTTVVDAVLPPGQVRLSWSTKVGVETAPSEPTAREEAPVEGARAQVDGTFHTEYVYENGVLTARTRVQYHIFAPGRETLSMIVPREMELLSVSDASGKPVADHAHNAKDGKLTIFLPARMTGEQTFEVVQTAVVPEKRGEAGKSSSTPVKFWPSALADVTRAVGTGAFRVPGENMKIEWTQRPELIPVNKIAQTLRGAFPTAPQYVWRSADPSSAEFSPSEVTVTRLARSVTRSFKIDRASAWTMITDGGETLTRCVFQVRNTGEQFLSLRLPDGAKLESAFVHTKPVTPGKGAAALEYYIPLVMSRELPNQGGGAPFEVEVVYTGKLAGPLGQMGQADLALARPTDELDAVEWTVFLPDGYRLSPVDGKFQFVGGAEPEAPELGSRATGRDEYTADPAENGKDFDQRFGANDKLEAKKERADSVGGKFNAAPKKKAPVVVPSEASNAGLLPIRVAFPRVSGGTRFQRSGTRSNEDLTLAFSYCRNKVIELARAVLESLAFLCCTGFVLAIAQRRAVAGTLVGALVALIGLWTLNNTFPTQHGQMMFGLLATGFLLFLYAICKPFRWLTATAALVVLLPAFAQAQVPGTPTVLVPYDEKTGVAPALQSLTVHALVPADVPEKVKEQAEKKSDEPEATPVPPVPFVVMRGDIEAKFKGTVAALDVTYQVRVLADGWQRIPLITGDLTVGAAQLGSEPGAVIVEENEAYVKQEVAQNDELLSNLAKADVSVRNLAREITTVLLVKGKGDYTVRFQGEATVAVDGAGTYRLSLSPPVFPQGTMTATWATCDLNVDGQGVARVEPQEDRTANTTLVKAPLTPARPVVLSWTERASAAPKPEEPAPAPEASASVTSAPAPAPRPEREPDKSAELEPLITARSVSKLTVDDASLRGDLVYTVNVHRKAIGSLTFLVPAGVNIYEVSGPQIQSPHRERATKDGRQVIVDFKHRFAGETQFIIRYSRPLKSDRKDDPRVELKVPAVRCREAAFESGTIGVEREGGVEVTEIEAQRAGLERIELPQLDPDTLRLLPGQILMAYTFANPPWNLALSVLRHQEVKELQTAVIRSLRAVSQISDQRVRTEMTFEVRNSGCPFLELELPEKAQLRRVTVNGRPVSASSDTDPRRQLIALEAPPAGEGNHVDQRIAVEYGEPIQALGKSGRRALTLAQANLPVIGHGLRWELSLPTGTVFKDLLDGVRPEVPRHYLEPQHAVPPSRGSSLTLHRTVVNFRESVKIDFEYGPPWSLMVRLIVAAILGFLMAAWITSGVTWITEGSDGLQRLVLAAIAGFFAIAWESRNPGTGAGFYAGGFIGFITPVGYRMLRAGRRWWAGAAATALVLFAVPVSDVRAQEDEDTMPEPVSSTKSTEPVNSTKGKSGAGWLEMGSEVLVPQDRLAKRMEKIKDWSVESRQSIQTMLAKLVAPAPEKPAAPDVQPPLSHVVMSGTLVGKVSAGDAPPSAAFDATYKVQVYQKGVVRLGFDPHEVAVRAVTLDDKPVAVLMDAAGDELAVPDALQVFVAEPGLHTIGVKLSARVQLNKDVHTLQLAVPACPATELDLEVPAREPALSVIPSTQVNISTSGEVSSVRTRLKYTQQLFVRWRDRHTPAPRATAAPEEATVFEVVEDLRYRLLPGLVETSARLEVALRSGAVSKLSLSVPEGTSVIGVEGAGVERWTLPNPRSIEVPFRSKMRGKFAVTVRCLSRVEPAREAAGGGVSTAAALPCIVVQDALSQSGVVRAFLPAGEDVREEVDRSLTKIDPTEAPTEDRSPLGDRVYRSVKPGWKLALYQVRREDVSTSSTRVTHGEVRVLVPRQGLWIARATYQVENETKQFLKVMLPRSSLLLSCTVDGQPRRPSKEEDSYLVPLAKSETQGTGLRPFPVVLVYGIVGSTDGELGSRGPLNVHLPVLELPVDRTRLAIGTPRDIFLYGEDPAFMSRETSITGILEGVLTLGQLPSALEVFASIFVGGMRTAARERAAPSMSLSEPSMSMERSRMAGYRNKGDAPRPRAARFAQKTLQRASRGISSLSDSSALGMDGEAGGAAPEAPATAEESAKEQQVAGFLEIMKKSGGSTGALPVDIEVEFGELRVTSYTLLLASPGKTPAISLRYVSMRWAGAIGGVFFFLVPVCLIAIMLTPGRGRVLPLALLAVCALIVAALAEWGLSLTFWFVLGIPAGVVLAPFLRLNRTLSAVVEE